MITSWNLLPSDQICLQAASDDIEEEEHDMLWSSGAVLHVSDPENFVARFVITEGSREFIVGVVHEASAKQVEYVTAQTCLKNTLQKCEDTLFFFAQDVGVSLVCVPTCKPLDLHQKLTSSEDRYNCNIHTGVTIIKRDGKVQLLSGSQLLGAWKVAGDRHYPCVLLKWDDTKITYSVDVKYSVESVRKRKNSCLLMGRVYEDRKFTDAVLTCRGHRIPVHRAILAAASPVFARMWDSGMREASEAAVDITDTEPAVLEAVVRYVYTSELPEDADVVQLFASAQKYELQALAEHTAEKMVLGLDASNVLQRCRTVHRHAAAGGATAQTLWEQLFSAVQADPGLMRSLVENALT
ncbi:unnamed protein product [Polarella glacialis]|uniref:BTB domain-containing protein n=1 Tax=Polarella glacialis TaxID=89957 RepID=A0A813KAL9_POLGL|nr:unnamed protein product [Polarella glacialis]CAE8698353.1 unnamed protein product [Polarella glacialis]